MSLEKRDFPPESGNVDIYERGMGVIRVRDCRGLRMEREERRLQEKLRLSDDFNVVIK